MRREGAAAGLSPRQQLPVRLRAAGVARRVPGVQGLADDRPAAVGHGDAGHDYYAAQTQTLQGIIRTIGGIIAVLMGVGAVFGAVNTMYSAVASRTREIATLRALGFGSVPVVVSVLVEAALLSSSAALIGGVVAWLAFDGYETATMNFQSFSQVAFAFAVTPSLLCTAIIYALIMGLVGGLLPAIRAARLPSRDGAAGTVGF